MTSCSWPVPTSLGCSSARALPASPRRLRASCRRPAWAEGAFNVKRFLFAVLLAPIRAYQRFISPALPRRCKYYPTCSAYAVDAVREFGLVRGTILAGWRLLRCNPLSHGGYDPVEAQ